MAESRLRRWTCLALLTLGACGKEVGRVPFAGEGASGTTLTMTAGDVSFWTDIDLKYEGEAWIHYEVELAQGGRVVSRTRCNPLGPIRLKLAWTERNLGGSHSRSGNGRMSCGVKLQDGGPTDVRARLVVARRPPSLRLVKADLVLRQ